MLHSYFGASYDEIRDRDADLVLGIQTRLAYEQYMFQESDFEEIARTIALFKGAADLSADGIWVRNELEATLGSSLDDAAGAVIFIYIAVISNGGRWSPAYLDHPDLAELLQVVPREVIAAFAQKLTITQQGFKDAYARIQEPSIPELRRWRYNPLIASPMIQLPSREIVVPQPRFIMRRISPSGLYYAVSRRDSPFSTKMGTVVEDYVGTQLGIVDGAQVIPEIVWGSPQRRSIDWFLVLPQCVVLVEVKSTRPSINVRMGDVDLVESLVSSLNRAREQIDVSHRQILEGNPSFAAVPTDRPFIGLTVTAEPFYTGNSSGLRRHLSTTDVPVLVASLRDLENLVPRSGSDLGAALLAITQDPELMNWPISSSSGRFLEHADNPILGVASDSLPFLDWADGGQSAQEAPPAPGE